VRTTTVTNSNKKLFFFGPEITVQDPAGTYQYHHIRNTVGYEIADDTVAVNATVNVYETRAPMSALDGMLMTPAAVTLRVSCTESLTLADGVVYVGQLKTKPEWVNETMSWSNYMNNVVSYSKAKSFTGVSLTQRPVKVNAVPVDMTEMSDFKELIYNAPTSGASTFNSSWPVRHYGFAPVYVWNSNGASLNIEVTIEWRVRISIDSPFHAHMPMHKPSSDKTWLQAITTTIEDGAQVVTDTVSAVEGIGAAMGSMFNAGSKVLALM
jgi:hypothetical protein